MKELEDRGEEGGTRRARNRALRENGGRGKENEAVYNDGEEDIKSCAAFHPFVFLLSCTLLPLGRLSLSGLFVRLSVCLSVPPSLLH